MTTAFKNEIRQLARQSVREALKEEFMKARASILPFISSKEQKEIEKLYKKPSSHSVRLVKTLI